MANSYFQFKQFRIEQGETAMKVTTEACLFGALSEKLQQPERLKDILDIGTGTGLLALMKAQQSTPEVSIDAIELDPSAFHQAQSNFENSAWSKQLSAIQGDISNFYPEKKYDLLLSNPPFFKDHFIGKNSLKNQALHTTTLGFDELASSMSRLVKPKGIIHVILPPQPMEALSQLMASHGFYCIEKVSIFNLPHKPVFREIACFSKELKEKRESSLLIKNELNEYSGEFVELLQPYYLHL